MHRIKRDRTIEGDELEASCRLGVARGTVPARLERLQDRGVLAGDGPT